MYYNLAVQWLGVNSTHVDAVRVRLLVDQYYLGAQAKQDLQSLMLEITGDL